MSPRSLRGRTLQRFFITNARAGGTSLAALSAAQPLLEEILASEVLTSWTALGCGIDKQEQTSEIGPIVRD